MSHDHGADDGSLAAVREFRERMNGEILGENNLVINRSLALDGRARRSELEPAP